MNFNSFRDILNNPDFFPSFQNAIEFAFEKSFSVDCNGVLGSNFEIGLCNEIMKFVPNVEGQREIYCMTNKEIEFYNSNSQYTIDCSNFNSKNWVNLKEEMKSLVHVISASDIYLVKVEHAKNRIVIQDGLSVKTSLQDEPYLHNDANGTAWEIIKNLNDNKQDNRANNKIGNILVVSGISEKGVFDVHYFECSIKQIYDSFPIRPLLGTKPKNGQITRKGTNYIFVSNLQKETPQLVVITDRDNSRNTQKSQSSFNRGIKLKKPKSFPTSFDYLVGSGAATEIGKIEFDFKKMQKDYMINRFGF